MILKKNDEVIHAETNNGKFLTTVKINGRFVTNPTIQQLVNDGWVEYTPPQPQTYVPTYEQRVVELIRQQYTLDAEFAILRQRDTKPEEFAQYNEYCEQCKQTARNEQNNA